MKRVGLSLAVAVAGWLVTAGPAAAAPARHKPAAKAKKPEAKAHRGARSDVERLGRGYRFYLAGDYAAAQQELRALASSTLLNRDYALYLLAQSEALTGARSEALQHFRQLAALQHPGGVALPPSRFASLGRARAADLAYELKEWSAARQGYQAVLQSPAPEVEPAVARFRLAEIAAAEKHGADAIAGFRRVFEEHPEHPLADRALARLRELKLDAAVTVAERIARARRLTAERQWQRALDELALIPADVTGAVRDEADYWIGTTHFKMRHGYEIAAEKLLAIADRLGGERTPEALFHGARAWSRADQDDRAIAGYRDLVRRFPHARQAAEASFLIGWLDYNRGHYKEALPGLETTLKQYGKSSFGDDARWYHGFSRWMLGDVEGALSDFQIVGARSGALDGGKGRYWMGRALDKLGRPAQAAKTWRALVGDYPLTYYSLQARARLREQGMTHPGAAGQPQLEIGPFGDARMAASIPPVGPIDEAVAAEPAIARADELLAAGLEAEAGFELDRADGALVAKYGRARVLPLLFDRYRKAQNFFRPHRLAESNNWGALRVDPHRVAAARGWWEEVYPLAYRPLVEKYGPSGNNPPYYLYTIMQKESAYNPHDVSYADAIGLLQMIPPTSRRVGERIGRLYTEDVLYDPEGNIQFGAWYIGHLLEKFKGQVALGAGSYNAGPKAMIKWIKKSGDRPLDEFIELCAYTQTREYMKKALDIYAHYLYLYEKQEYLPDNVIDPHYLENDIDY